MNLITRADLDGITCAVLLKQVEQIDSIRYVVPKNMQDGKVEVYTDDIIANLPYHENCFLWFDHHASNEVISTYKGNFFIAASAARVVYHYSAYDRNKFQPFLELLEETDRVDSAQLRLEDIKSPTNFFLLSLTLEGGEGTAVDDDYRNKVVELLCKMEISEVLEDREVKERYMKIIDAQNSFQQILLKKSRLEKNVIITDFRPEHRAEGNRFTIYSLFPDGNISLNIYHKKEQNLCVVSVGHSIFNQTCQVHVGDLCQKFGGGGHRGAGTCRFPIEEESEKVPQIIKLCLEA
ncbi:exopolyphosphatase [Candidatus Riflebacteria bacterium]